MKVNFTIGTTNYTVDIDANNHTLIRHGINKAVDKEGNMGANYGHPTETELGYFTNLGNAVNKAITDTFASSSEEIDLKGYVERVEAVKKAIDHQLNLK